MHRFGFLALLAILTLSTLTPARGVLAAPSTRPTHEQLNASMSRIVDLVNAQRRNARLAPLTVHSTLMSCAQQYSDVQASTGAINHTGPDGSNPGQRLTRCGYRWRHYGENLAAGYANPDELVAAWMASPGHRRNILNPKVREIGLGFAHRDNDPGQYYDYYVMELGVRR